MSAATRTVGGREIGVHGRSLCGLPKRKVVGRCSPAQSRPVPPRRRDIGRLIVNVLFPKKTRTKRGYRVAKGGILNVMLYAIFNVPWKSCEYGHSRSLVGTLRTWWYGLRRISHYP